MSEDWQQLFQQQLESTRDRAELRQDVKQIRDILQDHILKTSVQEADRELRLANIERSLAADVAVRAAISKWAKIVYTIFGTAIGSGIIWAIDHVSKNYMRAVAIAGFLNLLIGVFLHASLG